MEIRKTILRSLPWLDAAKPYCNLITVSEVDDLFRYSKKKTISALNDAALPATIEQVDTDAFVSILEKVRASQAWKERALCRDPKYKPDDFYPYRGSSQKKAKAACADCSVSVECREFGREFGLGWGIWGGEIMQRGPAAPEEVETLAERMAAFIGHLISAVEQGWLLGVSGAAVDEARELLAEWYARSDV